MSKLEEFIENNLVLTSYGDYEGIKKPNLEQLLVLQSLVQFEINESIKSLGIS